MDWLGGEDGVPLEEVLDADLSLAEDAGTGNHWCAGVGLEGSSGGAFIMLLGIDATGAECKTSLCIILISGISHAERDQTYPTSIGV